jgi:hypothetical protein
MHTYRLDLADGDHVFMACDFSDTTSFVRFSDDGVDWRPTAILVSAVAEDVQKAADMVIEDVASASARADLPQIIDMQPVSDDELRELAKIRLADNDPFNEAVFEDD